MTDSICRRLRDRGHGGELCAVPRCQGQEGAVVKNCVLMQDTVVEANAELDCVVTDKNVKITAGKKLSGTESFPVYVQKKHTV